MSATNQSPEAILRQIDAIVEELQTLRQTVQVLLQAEPLWERLRTTNPEGEFAWDIIQAAPGQRQFRTAEDVALYLREERSAWED